MSGCGCRSHTVRAAAWALGSACSRSATSRELSFSDSLGGCERRLCGSVCRDGQCAASGYPVYGAPVPELAARRLFSTGRGRVLSGHYLCLTLQGGQVWKGYLGQVLIGVGRNLRDPENQLGDCLR